MKNRTIIAYDYKTFENLILTIVFCINVIVFLSFTLLGISTDKYPIGMMKLYLIITSVGLIFFIIKLVIRLCLVKRKLKESQSVDLKIVRCENFPRDQYKLVLVSTDNKQYESVLKVSRKNRKTISSLLKEGTTTKAIVVSNTEVLILQFFEDFN